MSVTLRNIADELGVHPSTVSRALDPAKAWLVNEETRARVRAAAEELGYRRDIVASGLRRGRSSTIAVVVADIANPYIAPVVRGIENALEGRGFMALIAETQDDAARFNKVFDHLLSRRVDAIITTAARAGSHTTLKKIASSIPMVLAVRTLPRHYGFPCLSQDDEAGGRMAAEHLMELGHRRIAQLSGPTDISSFVDRARGFRAAVERAGLTVLEPSDAARRPILPEGQRLARLMLDEIDPPPTGVFAHNDLMALGALDILTERGLRCPRNVSVVGFNDSPLTDHTDPPLTTIRLPGYELGRLAAETAITLIEEPGRTPWMLTLPPSLVVRRSTDSPPISDPTDQAHRRRP
jgi:LacI family transcriptional regulator